MHTHHAAINALFLGTKRWFLVPPQSAFWSLLPSAAWASSDERRSLESTGNLIEIVQHADDVLYVPEGWGHCTLSEELTIGVGQEFIPISSMSS
eukprot:298966-Amphidinium_carterae.1